ncbi:hypothetical protein WISP_102355 [Willisornis vidua]|uniref:Uncharacterized protein n=1 Tax=Willisornis vidua TaxID=1566151 RepID=A0ABQ9CY19_9PASS|nr:hypothetical protein WISP_102355 [Willisornis vidua]
MIGVVNKITLAAVFEVDWRREIREEKVTVAKRSQQMKKDRYCSVDLEFSCRTQLEDAIKPLHMDNFTATT